jgi:hypothetical protein
MILSVFVAISSWDTFLSLSKTEREEKHPKKIDREENIILLNKKINK